MKIDKSISTILAISCTALAYLVWLIYFQEKLTTQSPILNYLPYLNASLNLCAATCLTLGLFAIKNKKIEQHKIFMGIAFVFSTLFLISYIIYHHFHGDSKFMGTGIIRPIYFFILITHIVLSLPTLPMVLITFFHAYKKNWEKHKKLARLTFPLWLYVSASGVLVVVFLKTFSPGV